MPLPTRSLERMAVPADGLLHPAALLALATLIVNDHYLKVVAPSPLTGILSGFAGVIIFPLVLQAAWEVLLAAGSRWSRPSIRAIMLSCLATGVGYAAVEVFPPATELYRHGLGALQWLPSATLAWITSQPPPALVPVLATSDLLDLAALAALIIPFSLGKTRASPEPR